MAEVVTLEALRGADPATADNSRPAPGIAGPDNSDRPSGFDGDAGLDEIAKLRGLTDRHRQQINGAKQEVQRWRERVQQQDAAMQAQTDKLHELELKMAEMNGRLQAPAPPAPPYDLRPETHPADRQTAPAPAPSTPPEAWKQAMAKILQYEPSEADLQTLWQASGSGQQEGALTKAELDAYLREQRQAEQEAMQRQAAIGAMIQAQHPELTDANSPVTARTRQIYDQLAADPAYKALYNESMDVVDPASGNRFNAGLIMHAAQQAKQELASAGSRSHLPTAGLPGAPAASPAPPPVVDKNSVISKGLADLLSQPDLIREAERAGIGTDPLSIWNAIQGGVPEATRESWARDAGLVTR